jgi:alkyl sulfatase BDS1-like metallo-beta-lactamase superfamily hydrolase
VTVIDPAVSAEVAEAALALYREHRGEKRVVAVIYTHSHVDHFGGVRGVVDEADVKAGRVKVIAPAEFTREAISENVYAGNAMSRRASYMYGNLLPRGARGTLGTGLGTTSSSGTVTLVEPTDSIEETGQTMKIDGLTYEFLMAPGTEAPAEMHFFIREMKALTAAENAVHSLHNLYTLRGAKVRDARKWPKALQETLDRWGAEAEVLYAPHHWPVWGNERVNEHLEMQRDLYKYIHDQTLRLANHGYNMVEAAEAIALPESLARYWGNRGYYGTVNHNVKAVWNFYLGFFDGNPARLHPLPPTDAGERYLAYMGGADAVVARARRDFEAGDYRWVAQVLDHVVSVDPEHTDAKMLLSDALEQMGYQAESGPWRNFYLTGARELRAGIQKASAPTTVSPDMIASMPLEMLLDFLAIHVDGVKAAGKTLSIDVQLTDADDEVSLVLENAVLHTLPSRGDADATMTLDRATLNEIVAGQTKLVEAKESGRLTVSGDESKLDELMSLIDAPEFWFNLATPVAPDARGAGRGR